MDMNNVNIEEIVKQVLSGMTGNAPAAAAASAPAAPAGNTIHLGSDTSHIRKNRTYLHPGNIQTSSPRNRQYSNHLKMLHPAVPAGSPTAPGPPLPLPYHRPQLLLLLRHFLLLY